MTKITREQRIEIYNKRKQGKSIKSLSKEYSINTGQVDYLIKLIDKHGQDILKKEKNNYYSAQMKEEMINKVLIEGHTVKSTSIEYGLTSNGILFNWIKGYKANG